MQTRYYKLTDIERDRVILDGVYAKDIQAYFSGVLTNVGYYARRGNLYKQRYLIEFAPEKKEQNITDDYILQNVTSGRGTFTPAIIDKLCQEYNIGCKVKIRETEYNAEIGKSNIIEVPATIIERYPHHLVVERKCGYRESFLYRDIVLFNVMRKAKSKKVC